ncbi:hypothetical protein DFH06DRAFT_1342839 [Mycena polygramma]|nr:hypothetical protein DFH06DRAFT_1342839 [Mycena polygramma]
MSGTLISVPHVDLTFRGLAIANDIVLNVREWGRSAESKRSHKGVAWSLGPKECGNDVPGHDSFITSFNTTYTHPICERDYLNRLDHLIDGA